MSEDLRRRGTAGAPRELLCMICGKEHGSWHAPNELWNAVERLPDGSDEHPFLCPTCFMARAAEKGIDAHFVLSVEREREGVEIAVAQVLDDYACEIIPIDEAIADIRRLYARAALDARKEG